MEPALSTFVNPQDRYVSGNVLLDSLPREDLEALLGDLNVLPVSSGDLLYPGHAQGDLDFVYFPISAVMSMIALMEDGSAVEAGTVGREGVVGSQCAFGSPRLAERWIAQVPGQTARMPLAAFSKHIARRDEVRNIIGRYTQAYISFLSQSVACNALHLLVQRCARWLLLTHDRAGRDEFQLTHEFLATMLGVRRPGVSVAAATLQSMGTISYLRGMVTIRDRAGLERMACDCYRMTTDEYRRLLGKPFSDRIAQQEEKPS